MFLSRMIFNLENLLLLSQLKRIVMVFSSFILFHFFVELTEDGVTVSLTVIDTPGFGQGLNRESE